MRQLNGALMKTEGKVTDLSIRDLASDTEELMVGSADFMNGVGTDGKRLQEPLESSDVGEFRTFCELRAL